MKITSLHLSHTNIETDSRILKEMRALAHEGHILCGIGRNSRENRQVTTRYADQIVLHSILLPSNRWTFLPKSVKHAYSILKLYIKMFFLSMESKPDIIHCHDVFVLPLAVVLKLVKKTKLVYDAHELESDTNGASKFMKKAIFATEKLCWKFIDALIVVSPSIKLWYTNNIGPKFSEVILNSPLTQRNDQLAYDNTYLRRKFNIPPNKKIFIYIGLLRKGRGIELIAEVFKDASITSHLVFLGDGELRSTLEDLMAYHSNIHVCGPVPHDQVTSIAQGADVGLCFIENISLSDYYCLPNKLFEYSFSGLPVIASNFPDLEKVISQYELGKTTNLSLEDILNNIKQFEQMQISPKIQPEKLYELSWEAQSRKLNNLYSKLTFPQQIRIFE